MIKRGGGIVPSIENTAISFLHKIFLWGEFKCLYPFPAPRHCKFPAGKDAKTSSLIKVQSFPTPSLIDNVQCDPLFLAISNHLKGKIIFKKKEFSYLLQQRLSEIQLIKGFICHIYCLLNDSYLLIEWDQECLHFLRSSFFLSPNFTKTFFFHSSSQKSSVNVKDFFLNEGRIRQIESELRKLKNY